MTGWDITLNAGGSVGTAELPIQINQRTNRPVRLVNVDEEIYKSGYTSFARCLERALIRRTPAP